LAVCEAPRDARGGLEGDLGSFAGGESGEEFFFLKEFRRNLGATIDEGEEEVAAAAGVANGPGGFDGFERAQAGDATLMGLGEGLRGRDADARAIVTAGAGPDDDGRERFARWEFFEKATKGREEIALLGTFAGKGAFGKYFAISGEKEGGICHTGFKDEEPIGIHGEDCGETFNFLKLKNSSEFVGNPCVVTEVHVFLRFENFTT